MMRPRRREGQRRRDWLTVVRQFPHEQTRGGKDDALVVGEFASGHPALLRSGAARRCADHLYGGSGSDKFEYFDVSESTAVSRDRIYDFATGDKIKVSEIDANTGVANDQAFVLDADASFSADEIRQTVVGSDLLVEFNVNGDATAEMSILLVGRTTALGICSEQDSSVPKLC